MLVVLGGGSHVFGGRARQLLAEGSERVAWAHLSSMMGLFTRAQNPARVDPCEIHKTGAVLTSVKSFRGRIDLCEILTKILPC